jgi:hypothetical protein
MTSFKFDNLKNDNTIMTSKFKFISKSNLYQMLKEEASIFGDEKYVNDTVKPLWVGGTISQFRRLLGLPVMKQPTIKAHFKPVVKKVENIILVSDTGDILHGNVAELPLLMTEFSPVGAKFSDKNISDMKSNSNLNIGNLRIVDEISENETFNVLVRVEYNFNYDGKLDPRGFSFTLTAVKVSDLGADDLEDIALEKITSHLLFLKDNAFEVKIDSIKLVSVFNREDEFKKVNMKLRDAVHLEIPDVNTDDKFKNIGENENCVREWLRFKLRKMGKKTINKLGDEDGVSISNIMKLCIKYRIVCVAYDVNGDVLSKHIPEKRNKSYPSLYFQAYNNHLYPLTGSIKMSKRPKFDKIEVVADGLKKLESILELGFKPSHVKATFKDIENVLVVCSFIHDKVKYIDNPEYYKCLRYLKLFDLEDEIYDTISIKQLGSIIEKKFNYEVVDAHLQGVKPPVPPSSLKGGERGLPVVKEKRKYYKTKSFWPNHNKFIKGGYTHCVFDELDNAKQDDIITLDKNKCYTDCLMSLPYLIHMDYRQNVITKIGEQYDGGYDINDKYLYLVVPDVSSILLPDTNVYSGKMLKYAYKNGVNFKILEEMSCKTEHNYFKKMIESIYSNIPDEGDAKQIINILIGKMEQDTPMEEQLIVDNIYNTEESELTGGYTVPINKEYCLNFTTMTQFDIYCRKPINIQIKDKARVMLFEKMVANNLTSADIVQVKTDSFSFLRNGRDLDEMPNKDLSGWKLEDFKPLKKTSKYRGENITFYQDEVKTANVLQNCYAGVGKTYDNVHNVIPELKANDVSFLILTPSHATASDYIKEGYPCQVSQYFGFNPKVIPDASHLIFDEVGLLDRLGNDFMYRMSLLGKTINARGDFKQLPPVMEKYHFNSPQYLSMLFGENVGEMKTNMRNDFTIEYYDTLINNEVDLQAEVRKYSVNWRDAEKIICFRNKTIKLYNKRYLEMIGEDDMIYIGSNLRCITNNLRKYNIYNNFYLTIVKIEDDFITFENGLTLPREKVMKCFKLGIAITLYGAQGKSFTSFHYPEEDMWFMNADEYSSDRATRNAYTLISRIKNKFY